MAPKSVDSDPPPQSKKKKRPMTNTTDRNKKIRALLKMKRAGKKEVNVETEEIPEENVSISEDKSYLGNFGGDDSDIPPEMLAKYGQLMDFSSSESSSGSESNIGGGGGKVDLIYKVRLMNER